MPCNFVHMLYFVEIYYSVTVLQCYSVHLFPLFTLDVNVLRSRSNYGIKYERMKRGEMKEWSWGSATLVFKS